MKKMVAYSSIGHMGFYSPGTAVATPVSLLGAMVQMVSHGLISGLLFLLSWEWSMPKPSLAIRYPQGC